MDDHHRGKFLLVRVFKDLGCGRTAAPALVCDQNYGFELLKLSFICMNLGVGHRWQMQGQFFAIKEPYLTIEESSNETCIRVDHPSDLLDLTYLSESQLTKAGVPAYQIDQPKMSPLQCKEAGNSAFKKRDFGESLACYSKGIHCFLVLSTSEPSASIDVKRDLFRNRSFIRLKLGQYEGAITDAIASLSDQTTDKLKELDAKAYLRASQASYALKHYDVAATYCRRMLDLQPDHKDGVHLLSKIDMRLSEQTPGVYDIASIQDTVSRQAPRVDAADFLNNTAVEASGPNRGRGLFATRNLTAGDLILAETAFAYVWDGERTHVMATKWNARFPNDLHIGLIGLWKVALQRVKGNPISGSDLLNLHGDHNELGETVAEVDGVSIVDTYQVHDIVARNAFQLGERSERKSQGSGVYIRSSYVNHSCVPNSRKTFLGDLLLLYATKDIKKGEELTITYGHDLEALASRREAMISMWNFQCDCPLCLVDGQVSGDILERRDGLVKAAESFIQRSSSREGTTNSMLLQAERFARDISATYDSTLYSGLPRTALIAIQSWLVEATITCRNVDKSMRSLPNLLRSLGYNVNVPHGSIEHITPTTNSILADSAFFALWEPLIGTAFRRDLLGDTEVASHLTGFIKTWDRIMHGTDAKAVQAFGEHSSMSDEYRARIAAMTSGMARMST